ncbi:hypothetical protein [Actinoplanes sp. NPDC051411]|uniref:hypothetical protein n=1 Tax=Actinoplanes sp. NPDC051411 TaxID=3155522 RepID=UPI0034433808
MIGRRSTAEYGGGDGCVELLPGEDVNVGDLLDGGGGVWPVGEGDPEVSAWAGLGERDGRNGGVPENLAAEPALRDLDGVEVGGRLGGSGEG